MGKGLDPYDFETLMEQDTASVKAHIRALISGALQYGTPTTDGIAKLTDEIARLTGVKAIEKEQERRRLRQEVEEMLAGTREAPKWGGKRASGMSAVDFLRVQYGQYLEVNVIFMNEIRKLDGQLAGALGMQQSRKQETYAPAIQVHTSEQIRRVVGVLGFNALPEQEMTRRCANVGSLLLQRVC